MRKRLSKYFFFQENRVLPLIVMLICISYEGFSQNSIFKSSSIAEPQIEKLHFVLNAASSEDIALLKKCIAKYPYWNKHRMLTRRRIIEVASPHAATIELYSATELQNLYGKRILPGITDHDSDYYKIIFEVTPSGFKEVIVGSKTK